MSGLHFHMPISEQIWDGKYRLRDENKEPLEATVEDSWRRVARALSKAEKTEDQGMYEAMFYDALSDFKYLPAGRILAGAGTGRNVTLFNCFVMGTVPDSMGGIFDMLKEAALTMQQGGGIGYDFSTLRPRGALVKGVAADASGPLTFMDVWDAMCRTVMSAGSRRGAMMATMRCDHPDIEAFIDAKKDAGRLRMFNMSVLITDEFMAAKEREDDSMPLRFNGTVYRTISARALWDKIMRNTYDQAEPGVIFIDRINAANNLSYMEYIASTNPCGEQPLPPYGACLLGSINMARIVRHAFTSKAGIDLHELENLVYVAIRMMDNVIDVSKFPLPQQEAEARMKRRLGLGVTGLADALIMVGLRYGSPEAVARTEKWMQTIAHAAYRASIRLAQEKGAFPGFQVDGYLAEGTHASTMPRDITDGIRKHGIRNSHLTSIAPTGTISMYAGNVSSGIEPVFAFAYERKLLNDDGSKRVETVEDYAYHAYRLFWEANLDPMKGQGEGWDDSYLPDYFVSAQTLSPQDHVVMQAAAQRFVDSSISKTINVPVDIPFEEFKGVYQAAWDRGCKGCTTYRPNDITGSILSVTEAPAEPEPIMVTETVVASGGEAREATIEDICRYTAMWLSTKDREANIKRKEGLKAWLEEHHDEAKVSTLPKNLWLALLAFQDTYPQPEPMADDLSEAEAFALAAPQDTPMATEAEVREATLRNAVLSATYYATIETDVPTPYSDKPVVSEEPLARPVDLDGTTYKIKWPNSGHALYVTLTNIVDPDTGALRPFECFFNSKNMEHFAWTVALSRMISAVFRRPHDSSFVAEELKAVFDPKGGAWMDGKYVPSILAAIGGVIEKHMIAIGYIAGPDCVKNGLRDKTPEEEEAMFGKRKITMPEAMTAPYGMDLPGVTSQAQAEALAKHKNDLFFQAIMERESSGGKANPSVVGDFQRVAMPVVPPMCGACGSSNVKREAGCFACKDCGTSNCG